MAPACSTVSQNGLQAVFLCPLPFPLPSLPLIIPFPPIIIMPFPGDFVSKHPVGPAVLVVFRIFMPFPFPGDLVLLFKQSEIVGTLDIVGSAEGVTLGVTLGCEEGLKVGCAEGATLGIVLGCVEGLELGCTEGLALGVTEGLKLGCTEGLKLG